MRMLLSGVMHIHENDIVHRDMKLENAIIDGKFSVRIIDFGLACVKP